MTEDLSKFWWVWEAAEEEESARETVQAFDAVAAAEKFLERLCSLDWDMFRIANFEDGQPLDVFVRNVATGKLHRMEVGTDRIPVFRVSYDQSFNDANEVHDVPLPPDYKHR